MSTDIIGKKIGNYEIIERIGEGGMGKVYKGIHNTLDRIVALKMINPELVNNTEIIGRFYNEAKIHAQLNHPNIVTVYDFIKQNDNYYIVMEYVKGESIGNIIKDQGPFEVNIAINIFNQIFSGIYHAHKKGIIHRDVKPNNFILTPNVVKITDFGIAHIISNTGYTMDGSMLGTPKYMSPEQILGNTLDHRSDIYSLGISMYEILTGRPPFESESNSDYEVKKGHVELEPPRLSSIKKDIPPKLEEVVLKAIAKKPEDRYESVQQMIEAINNFNLIDISVNKSDNELKTTDLWVEDKESSININNPDTDYDDTGDIDEYSLHYIISNFYKERRTGILHIDSKIRMSIYFIKGYIVYVEGNNERYALAKILVDNSKITKEDQAYAISFAHETGLKIGEALIKMGKINPHELSQMLETQIKKKLIEGLEISSGKYYFQDTQNLNLEVMYNINPMQIIYDSLTDFDPNRSLIYRILCDRNTRIKTSRDISSELLKIKLNTPKEIKFAGLLESDQSVGELIEKSPLDDTNTLRFLLFLKLTDLIDMDSDNSVFDLDSGRDTTKDKKQSNDRTDRMTSDEIEQYKSFTHKE